MALVLMEQSRGAPSEKDIIAKADDIVELQGDVLLVWDAHIIHKCLRKKGGRRRLSRAPASLCSQLTVLGTDL